MDTGFILIAAQKELHHPDTLWHYTILYVCEKPNLRTRVLYKSLLRCSFTIHTHAIDLYYPLHCSGIQYISEKLNLLSYAAANLCLNRAPHVHTDHTACAMFFSKLWTYFSHCDTIVYYYVDDHMGQITVKKMFWFIGSSTLCHGA